MKFRVIFARFRVINMQLLQEFTKIHLKKNIPAIKPGDIVRVYQKIREAGKERIQVFEGIVISRHAGDSLDATFTVRRVSFGIGIERVFPLHSPALVKIEKIKSIKVHRAKLYYLRGLVGKKAKKHEELKEFEVWKEPEAKEEEEKLKAEKEAEAKTKEEAKNKEQEELEKKFAQAQAAKSATERSDKS